MKLIVCLHGNPLQGQEFDSLIPIFEAKGFQTVIHKRPIKGSKLEPLLQSVSATSKVSGGPPFSILAYSWGAYLALAYLNRFPENVTEVLLVNPLVSERKLTFLEKVMTIPFLRAPFLKFRSKKMTLDYLSKIFIPDSPTDAVKQHLESSLSHASVWKGNWYYKKLMAINPVNDKIDSHGIPIKVMLGKEDQAVCNRDQLLILEKFKNIEICEVPNASHDLPWSHPHLIAEKLTR